MKSAALLVLVATVIGVDGGSIRIDKGSADGLEQGDTVAVYYTLTVRSEEKRVDVGSLRVTGLEEASATLSGEAAARVRPGFLAEVRIPADRISPESLLKLVGRKAPEGQPAAAPEAPAAAAAGETGRGAARPVDPLAGMVRIPAGRYEIGSDLSKNVLYSQHPRFDMSMEIFWIDAGAVSRQSIVAAGGVPVPGADDGSAVGLNYFAAEAYCRSLGKRLPTEFEWEVAAAGGSVARRSDVYEWTASWYVPYPGNKIQEPEYGEKFRVLRGGVEGSNDDPRARRFMDPASRSSSVGFRCAADPPAESG